MSKVEQHIKVNATDPIEFAKLLLELGAKGARIKNGSYVFLRNYPLSCEVVVEVTPDTQIESNANISAIPVPHPLTEEQLNELEYDVLLKMGEEAGVKSRKKADIIKALVKGETNIKGDADIKGETPKGESKSGE